MSIFTRLALIACLSIVVGACANQHEGEPSEGAQDMPGAEGTFEFKPSDWNPKETSWWTDSDGVNPGAAGCHIGTDDKGVPNGRSFGEDCLPNGLLVESNPGTDELHSHAHDIGHPDTIDCNAWCVGNGKRSGVCKAASAPPCEKSAACVCD